MPSDRLANRGPVRLHPPAEAGDAVAGDAQVLGACLGGNLTIVGVSANVVVANLATRAGHPIRFMEFLSVRRAAISGLFP